jgi:voltage-gated potassium channel
MNTTSYARVQRMLALLSLIYVASYTIQVTVRLEPEAQLAFTIFDYLVWFLFLCDLVFRFLKRESLTKFFQSSWLEILALLLPFARSLRAFRLLLALRALAFIKSKRRHTAVFWLSTTIPFTWYLGALAMLDSERDVPGATIVTLDKALWWSITTITTVGYGDLYPVTFEGRIIAVALMISGISLFSAGAGVLASWILEERDPKHTR